MRLIKSHMQIIPEKVRIIQKMQKKTIDNIIMEKNRQTSQVGNYLWKIRER